MDSSTVPMRSIRDYFAAPEIFSQARDDAQSGTIGSPTRAFDGSHETSSKKIRITANNGRDIALRGLQEKQVKKVKRESTEESLNTTTSAIPARRIARRAKLALLLSMPLDVLLEIFSHLLPLDILRLSRTTKELRKLLLHRSSTYVWKTALNNVPGLPACPEDLSLPFWTNLLFDHHCQNCLTNNVKKCDFVLRVRYCNNCVNEKLLQQSEFDESIKLHRIILKCIPFSNWNSRTMQYCTIADRNNLLDDLELVSSRENPSASSEFVAQKRAEVKARLVHAQTCKTWMNDVLRSREIELRNSRKSRAKAIREKLVELGYSAALEFLDELKAGICAIQPMPGIEWFEYQPLVKLPKPLTEKGWAAIKDEMLKYITLASRLRQKNIRCIAIRDRRTLVHTAYVNWRTQPANLRNYPADSPMPSPADVFEFPPIERMINARTERELDIDRDIMPCLTWALPAEIEEWREDIASDLLRMVTSSRLWEDAEWRFHMVGEYWDQCLRFFERAVIVFRCTHSTTHWLWEEARLRADVVFPANTPNVNIAIAHAVETEAHAPIMWYPQFVHHKCATMKFRSYDERRARAYESLSMEKEYKYGRHATWKADTMVFDERASRVTRNIVEACGMNWKMTTTQQLDKRDPRLVCLKCSFGVRCDGERKVRVWTWRDAVQHCLSAHFGDTLVAWECLSLEDTTKARLLEAAECVQRGFHASTDQKIWRCIKCRDTTADTGRMSWDALADHFRQNTTHGDADNMEGKEGMMYYRALDVCPREGPPVKMIPSKTDPSQAWKWDWSTAGLDVRSMNRSALISFLRMPPSP